MLGLVSATLAASFQMPNSAAVAVSTGGAGKSVICNDNATACTSFWDTLYVTADPGQLWYVNMSQPRSRFNGPSAPMVIRADSCESPTAHIHVDLGTDYTLAPNNVFETNGYIASSHLECGFDDGSKLRFPGDSNITHCENCVTRFTTHCIGATSVSLYSEGACGVTAVKEGKLYVQPTTTHKP